MRGIGQREPASVIDVGLYLLGVVGMAASITTIWLLMRSVMDIGGFCAEGGPYVIEQALIQAPEASV
jgi:hypothetical protein